MTATARNDVLLPCPFCGMKARLFPMWTQSFSVSCLHCEAEGPMRRTEPEAIDGWNNRVPSTQEPRP
ncbi:Lar family restriction alleviation protein [Burkholderia cenocepacia]|uniref:Lar family restriction alleviation protein n=1 Tax=Burkholderia cenocepacia TaxID=95486 RepID=UPI002862584C|nr:Lar family restriction alleviation protein [Burkholderia cenocepacia]MDR8102472.1 Lar family restriction alleviation protein [Burkholderia cenocepacia]